MPNKNNSGGITPKLPLLSLPAPNVIHPTIPLQDPSLSSSFPILLKNLGSFLFLPLLLPETSSPRDKRNGLNFNLRDHLSWVRSFSGKGRETCVCVLAQLFLLFPCHRSAPCASGEGAACCSRRDSFKRRGRKMRSVSENNNISSSLPLFFFYERAFKARRLEEWQ